MIEADKRKAIYLLHQEGMSIRQIARRLHLSRNTVRRVIQQQGQMPAVIHADKLHIDEQLLRDLYQQCQGRIQRMHELLTEEHKIQVIGNPQIQPQSGLTMNDGEEIVFTAKVEVMPEIKLPAATIEYCQICFFHCINKAS